MNLLRNLTFQVFIAALFGIGLALVLGDGVWTEPLGQVKTVFLAALRMLIAPMIFFSLVGGIAGIGNVVRLRRLGGVTVAYYLSTTAIAAALGLIAVFLIHPWTAYPAPENLAPAGVSRLLDPANGSITAIIGQILERSLTNPFTALVELNILGIVANAFLIGIAMVLVLPAESPLFRVVADTNAVIARVLGWVIRVLPIGIFAILFEFTASLGAGEGQGANLLRQLLSFGALVVSLTLFHGIVILPAIAWLFAGRSPVSLFGAILRPLLVAFSTSSSSATLPVTMRTAEENLAVDPGVSSFVLPLGATMNMDGTALFEAVGAVFLAYLFGVDLSSAAIVTVFVMAMMASIGAPGMPSASMAGMQMVLLAVGIPLEAIAILLIIERPLDTIRTSLNVEGDLVGCLVVDRYCDRRDGT